MAIRRRTGTYQRDPDAPQRLDADNADLGGMESQIQSQSEPGIARGGSAVQTGQASARRGASVFNYSAGPREQAYQVELDRPEEQFTRLPQATGKKRVFGKILSQFRGTHNLGQEMVYGDELRHRQDYETAVAERGRKLAHLGAGANLEANRRTAENLSMYRTADLNLKYDRRAQERELQPGRLGIQQSVIKRNEATTDAQKALAKQRGASGANSPFGVLPNFAGTYNKQTGKIGTPPDNAGYIRSRIRAGAAGRGNEIALSTIEKDKVTQLNAQEKIFSKEVSDIEKENQGINPQNADGTPNPFYTFDAKMKEANRRNDAAKQRIQNGYEQRLKRLGQNVEHYSYTEGGEEPGGPDTEDLGAAVDMQDQTDTVEANAGPDEEDPDELVTIETPDGRQGTIPASRLQEAIENGAKLINRGVQ